jgi:hypothetical protein
MWLILMGAITGALLPFYLAERWGKWWLAIVAALLGVVASVGLSAAGAAILHFFDPMGFPMGNLLAKVIGFSAYSLVIAPVAALLGWRKARKAAGQAHHR